MIIKCQVFKWCSNWYVYWDWRFLKLSL